MWQYVLFPQKFVLKTYRCQETYDVMGYNYRKYPNLVRTKK